MLGLFSPFPNVRFSGDDAGLHLLLTVDSMPERALVEKARAALVRVRGLSEYAYLAQVPPGTLVMGYAGLEEAALKEAAGALLMAWGLSGQSTP